MTALVYANAYSLFDYSNGASRSLLLLLEKWAASGIKVYAITSCSCYTEESFNYTQGFWKDIKNERNSVHPSMKKFILNGVNHTIILNSSHSRQGLESLFQEIIYRETVHYLDVLRKSNETIGFLSWGNLLLEESLFKQAKAYNFRTIFYLANPSYLGKFPVTLSLADCIFTDSKATQNLYRHEIKAPIRVIPKIIGPSSCKVSPHERWKKKNIYFVNPCIKKGLQYAIELAYRCKFSGLKYNFIFIDSMAQLNKELEKLVLPTSELPNNIIIKQGLSNLDNLYAEATLILLPSIWHESGSRLILEGHQRGIPVLAFATGGTPELMTHSVEDLFEQPESSSRWDSSDFINRINVLMTDYSLYHEHSNMLRDHSSKIEQRNCEEALTQLNQALK